MRKFIFEVLLRQRTSQNVVRKTDDELTRYVKQKRITSRRLQFEEAMSLETLAKQQLINTREIRTNHYIEMQSLDQTFYNKGFINDNILDYDFLHKRHHYLPLGQKYRPFFTKPSYARRQDWEESAGIPRYLIRSVLGLICIGLGLELGKWDSKDELLAKANVVDFETEEQIYDLLYNQKKLAVFVYLYSPGIKTMDDFNNVFERESSKYLQAHRKKQDPECEEDEEDDIVFMRINCRKHLNFCLNKQWNGRIQPSAEVYSVGENDQLEMIDFENWHRSAQGIEGFFTKLGLVDDRFNPEELLERGGRKFVQII